MLHCGDLIIKVFQIDDLPWPVLEGTFLAPVHIVKVKSFNKIGGVSGIDLLVPTGKKDINGIHINGYAMKHKRLPCFGGTLLYSCIS
jgi:hypothetical protein